MKRSVKIAIAAASVAIVAIAICAVVILVKPREPLTALEFNSLMEEKGYSIVDVKEQFAEYDYISEAYLAIDKNGDYQLEFYVIESPDIAARFFESNKAAFESSKGNMSSQKDISAGNYSKYTLTSEGQYKYICRIENTVIYADEAEEYKPEIKEIAKKLGY